MATKRFCITKNEDRFIIENFDKSINYTKEKNEDLVITLDNWDLTITDTTILINAKSRAKNKRCRNFAIDLEEGSLFLYNSSTNWYWYFRPKILQDKLDELKIDRIISIKDDEKANVDFYAIEDMNGKLHAISNLESPVSTPKIYSPNDLKVAIFGHGNMYSTKVRKGEKVYLYIAALELNFKDWMIVESRPGHRTLYLKKRMDLRDIRFNDYLIELTYPLDIKG